jgi:L-ribulose-5-phosphate 4-epimerase
MSAYRDLKERAWEHNLSLVQQGLVKQTFGNLSVLDHDRGLVAIKPSGVSYETMKPDDIVVVTLENKIIEGSLRPSSDTRTHTFLYRHFDGIRAIVHTHSPYAVAWAQAMRPIPILGTTHADYVPEDIPCTEIMSDGAISRDYEEETGVQIVQVFARRSPLDVPMVLVAAHGPFAWGTSAAQAVHHAVMLEELARMAYVTLQINPTANRLKATLIAKHYERKHGPHAYYGQPGQTKGDNT